MSNLKISFIYFPDRGGYAIGLSFGGERFIGENTYDENDFELALSDAKAAAKDILQCNSETQVEYIRFEDRDPFE